MRTQERWRLIASWVVVVILAIGLVVMLVRYTPALLASTHGLSPNEAAQERGRIRTALLAVGAGLLAVVGAYYTHRTFVLSRSGQITERITKAVEQLGSDTIDVRLGGIYALERVARDSPEDQPQIVEILMAFLRNKAPAPHESSLEQVVRSENAESFRPPGRGMPSHGRRPMPPPDVHAVVKVLARRDVTQDPPNFQLDLSRTDLRGIELVNATGIHGAHMDEVRLDGAQLSGADLQGASLQSASLLGAWLSHAHLGDTLLMGADLRAAFMMATDFRGSHGAGAHVEYAVLQGARFEGCTMPEHIEGAYFSIATYDESTNLPTNFDPIAAGMRKVSARAPSSRE